jgi:hypothetical protein
MDWRLVDEVLIRRGELLLRFKFCECMMWRRYSGEEEVHDIVREYYADLFGAGSIYFGFEPKI